MKNEKGKTFTEQIPKESELSFWILCDMQVGPKLTYAAIHMGNSYQLTHGTRPHIGHETFYQREFSFIQQNSILGNKRIPAIGSNIISFRYWLKLLYHHQIDH